MTTPALRRVNIYITEHQHAWMAEYGEKEGIPAAEVVRRAIDAWIASHTVKNEPLFKHSSYSFSDLFKIGGGDHASIESVNELQTIVELVVNALRRTASSEVMADFDARLEQSRAPKGLPNADNENPDTMSS